MLKIMIMCLGGFSSSALAAQLENEVREKGMDDQVQFIFPKYGARSVEKEGDGLDIVMLCPHMAVYADKLVKAYPHIPFYIIPTRLYGMMKAEELIEDAEDAIAGFQETGMNPFHFEGENVAIRVHRTVSHRKFIAQKNEIRSS